MTVGGQNIGNFQWEDGPGCLSAHGDDVQPGWAPECLPAATHVGKDEDIDNDDDEPHVYSPRTPPGPSAQLLAAQLTP